MNAKFKNSRVIRLLFYPLIILRRSYFNYKNRKIRYYQDIFSNIKEGSLVVSMEDIPGNFEIDVRSHLLQRILITKTYEPEIAALIKNNINPKKDAIDVGANIGFYANYLATLINSDCKVLAIEPTPLAFEYLNNNIKRNNNTEKVIFFNGVCTNKPGDYTINTVIGKEEYSSIGENEYMSNLNEKIVKYQVKGETLSNLVIDHQLNPGLIVIDVEGAEMKVLEGAIEIIKKFRPIIISELVDDYLSKQGTTSTIVIELLEELNYEVQSVNENKNIMFPFFGSIIAIPKN